MYDIFKGFYDTIGSEDFSITKLFWCSTIIRVKKSYVISKNQNQEIAYLLRRFGLGFHDFDYFLYHCKVVQIIAIYNDFLHQFS